MRGKAVKKPIELEYFQFTSMQDFHLKDLGAFVGEPVEVDYKAPCIYIKTLEGKMKANLGDYIIKGFKGECYPCKQSIFENTYSKI